MREEQKRRSWLLMLIVVSFAVSSFTIAPARAQGLDGPLYTYGTYVGGRSDDHFNAIAIDTDGNIYLAGSTYSTDFPGVSGKQNTSEDMVILSFDAAGTTLRWAKIIGGSGTDQANAIVVDNNGHLWLTGLTDSADFPVTSGGSSFAGYYDVVLAELDGATGNLLYSNLYGDVNSDQGNALAIGPSGTLYLTGQASDESGFRDVLAMAFDRQRHTVLKAIRFGRERGEDMGNAIAVDQAGNIYITGKTESQGQDNDFPLVNPFQDHCGIGDGFGDCGDDAFIIALDGALATIQYSTYLGGSYNNSEIGSGEDAGTGIAVDADGSIYVTGYTFASDFPVANAFQAAKSGADNFADAFVLRLNPTTNTLIFSTYLGGEDWDEGHALHLDGNGNVYVGGMTNARNFPVLNAPQPILGNGVCNLGGTERYCYDGFVASLAATGALRWSTYLGGGLDDDLLALTLDKANHLLVAGGSKSPNFPVSANAYQETKALLRDGFLAQFGDSATTPTPTPPGDTRQFLPLVVR